MLILTRRAGEALTIGDEIRLTVLSISTGENGSVVLGIDAPRDTLILRSELRQAISVNKDSAQASSSPQAVAALERVLHQSACRSEDEPRDREKEGD